MMKILLKEAMWARNGWIPTINKYIENRYVPFVLGPIVLPALYLIGPKLSEEIVQSCEYRKLFELMGTHGRLLNDIRSFKRELTAGQLNAVTLHKNYGKSGIEEEEIIEKIKMLIKNRESELMKLVMEAKGSIVPNACKYAFWKTCNMINVFYATDDGYYGNTILDIVNEVIYEPISQPLMLVNETF